MRLMLPILTAATMLAAGVSIGMLGAQVNAKAIEATPSVVPGLDVRIMRPLRIGLPEPEAVQDAPRVEPSPEPKPAPKATHKPGQRHVLTFQCAPPRALIGVPGGPGRAAYGHVVECRWM